MQGSVEECLDHVLSRISDAAIRSGRSARDITLVAVSKTHSAIVMNQVADALRARDRAVVFGESYLQEYQQKRAHLRGEFSTHMIGPLQSNKVAKAVGEFDLIQSVHSEKVLRLIDKEARVRAKMMPIFLQINVSRDAGKSGFMIEQLDSFMEEVVPECSAISVEGLMTITEFYEQADLARGDFMALRQLGEDLAHRCRGVANVAHTLALSMGMSADYEVAIEEGATHVRVGSAIFGVRESPLA